MAYSLEDIAARGARQCCGYCDKRNSIENLFFCLQCGEICCWQCINRRGSKVDPADDKMHAACSCGQYLKSYDDWAMQR